MKHTTTIRVDLSEDEKTATVRLSTQSSPVVCDVLGIESTEGGARDIYLNARIHRRSSGEYEGWEPRGAISTILRELL